MMIYMQYGRQDHEANLMSKTLGITARPYDIVSMKAIEYSFASSQIDGMCIKINYAISL